MNYVGVRPAGVRKDSFEFDRYKQFLKYFPDQAMRVLDIGCNTGRGGNVLKTLRPELSVVGLDIDPHKLALISRSVYDDTICGSSGDIPAEDKSFDVIVQGEFIEHISFDDVLPTLRECHRVLRQGGRLLLTTPNPQYVKLRLTGGSVMGGEHISQHYWSALHDQMEFVGFQNVQVLGTGKVSRYLGQHFPMLQMYGSYMMMGDRLTD